MNWRLLMLPIRAAAMFVRRLLSHAPRNPYEEIVFIGVRAMIDQMRQGRIVYP